MQKFLSLLSALILAGCNSLPLEAVPNAALKDIVPASLYSPPLETQYNIQIGDRIILASYYYPLLNQEVLVRPDGRISLLLMDDVYVRGITPSKLDEMITQAYSQEIESPDVTVVIKESASSSIYVGGEVRHEAAQNVRGPITITQAITSAGGFLSTANKKQVLLLRKQEDGQFITYQLDTDLILLNQAPSIYLQRTDVVYVPKSQIANIGQFVDQYINNIIPEAVRFNYSYTDLKTKNGTTTVITQ